MVAHPSDIDLTAQDIGGLTSPDAVAAFLTRLGYPTGCRQPLTATALGLAGETAEAIQAIELLAKDDEGFFQVVFVKLRSVTAKARNDLARNLGKRNIDHLIILTNNFEAIEFVLLDKQTRQQHAPGGGGRVLVIPRTVSVVRKLNTQLDRRILRRLTWTGKDGLDQFDKLRSVFEAAAFTGEYFQNRALFADHYLVTRLREDEFWKENPSEAFSATKELMRDCRTRWTKKDEQVLRTELYEPLWKLLGFKPRLGKTAKEDRLEPDYALNDKSGQPLTAAFVYRWDRWLDGPDLNDPETPQENPGAAVVTALAEGRASWIIVTNGKLWRLYSRDAHSRSTNFYEVDLEEALLASGETDPNEAFRYWWLFFRSKAFAPAQETEPAVCWLDTVMRCSRDYAKRLSDRLKDRVFVDIFPHLAQGFLTDRKKRLGITKQPTEAELKDIFEATLTLLYRLLFLLHAEARDLLPIREAPYHEASLKKIKTEVADKAGVAESDVADHLKKAYADNETSLYDRLTRLFEVMDQGDPTLNVPCYNGGLFITEPGKSDRREERIARFLLEHRVPDRYLALAIDRLARDQDEKTFGLVFIDYKSLEVRHLGSIYEGLLEFRLKLADEDLTTQTEKKSEKYIPLAQAKAGRGKKASAAVVVRKGEVFLSNDKAERKATGSYYTPDPIVEYIVEHTVGPVLNEKLEGLRDEFNKAAKTYHRHLTNANNNPGLVPKDTDPRTFAAAKTYAEHKDVVERLFDFKMLDPAMGSGHFLVEGVDFLTDRILDFLNRFPHNPVSFALAKTRQSIQEALTDQGVTVNTDKLTDINLLKRHVLKRCIYGVDLNPMAVELAKVSLWLDAFTLGAPLSFLDHHLRCGNSLIGATFKDLTKATQGQLFSINYEPLLRAINHVLFVNAMADATAAEVHKSADEYAGARAELSGYQIVLDLLVARHFGFPKAPELLTHAQELDLTTRDLFLASLHDNRERQLVGQVADLAGRADLRFFHWEIEFPEVFFGFVDVDQRLIRHKDETAAGSAGFDAIVGNPPYVRQESIKPLKDFLQDHYTTYDSTNDLYVYFQEQEVRSLKVGGRMGMIVANKWMRAAYGRRLRAFLQRTAEPLEVIDFGHSPIFPDADTFPCIPIVARRASPLAATEAPQPTEEMLTCGVPREHWDERMNLGVFVQQRCYRIPTLLLREEGWSLEDPRVQALLEKIRNTGVPLREYCGSSPNRGPVTGLNEAFFIDAQTRDGLIREDRRSADIIRPLLRGRDIERWQPRTSSTFLIVARRGIEINRYPAIKRHLSQFRDRLEPRPPDWDIRRQGKWPGRAPGDYAWCELQASPGDDLLSMFTSAKIVWQDLAFHSRFCFESEGTMINDLCFAVGTRDKDLLAILNSPLMWWFLSRTVIHGKDEVLRLKGIYTEALPIPDMDTALKHKLASTAEELMGSRSRQMDWEQEIISEVSEITDSQVWDTEVLGQLCLPTDVFCRRIAKSSGIKKLAPALAVELSNLREKARARQVELLTRQLDQERRLADLVEEAYGLTAEERTILRTTRPIRDPLDVLEARIGGKNEEAPAHSESQENDG